MSAYCPNCGYVLAERPSAHRGELERQLGDPARAEELRRRAAAESGVGRLPVRLDADFIAQDGMVWTRCRVRKATICWASGVNIVAGEFAYRQLSEVRHRERRVAALFWDVL